ncbi:toxin TcdB middle/N-terminal domain-containing protein, partial [bacterium]
MAISSNRKLKSKLIILTAIVILLASISINPLFALESSGPNPGNKLGTRGIPDTELYTGAFTYTYPIEVPSGRCGIQPDLKLVYNSNNGNGWLGIGWDLSAGGAIYRNTKNGIPEYSTNDTYIFSLHGATQELVMWDDGTDETGYFRGYQARIETGGFIRFRHYTSSNIWYAWDKSGTKYEFRNLFNSFYWGLTKVTGTDESNIMTIEYNSTSSLPRLAPGSGAPSAGGTMGYLPNRIVYRDSKTIINFIFEERPDIITYYRSGCEQKMTRRLKQIKIESNGQNISKYELVYSDTYAGLSRLDSIQQYGSDNESALPPTTFTWQYPYSGAVYDRFITASLPYADPEDADSDADWQQPANDSDVGYVYLDDGAALIDVNGDSLLDIVQYKDAGPDKDYLIGAWLNTCSGWERDDTWRLPEALKDGSEDTGIRFADINGDGLMDILKGKLIYAGNCTGSDRKVWLNNGNGWTKEPADSSWVPPTDFIGNYTDEGYFDTGARLIDINGDGLPDIVQYLDNDDKDKRATWLNTGNGWEKREDILQLPTFLVDKGKDLGVRFADINGDGLIDVLRGYNDVRKAWLNTGVSWIEAPESWNPVTDFIYDNQYDDKIKYDAGTRLVDINRDGLVDIVQRGKRGVYITNAPEDIGVWLNKGNGWKEETSGKYIPPTPIAVISNASGGGYQRIVQLSDLNGDGKVDIFCSWRYSKRVYIRTDENYVPLIKSITNSLGGVTNIAYDTYLRRSRELSFPVTIVKSMSIQDGIGTMTTLNYSYSGGLYDRSPYAEREFLGFKEAKVTDAVGNYSITKFLQNEENINNVNIYKGRIKEQAKYSASGSLLTKTVNSYSYTQPYNGIYFPYVSRIDNYFFDKHTRLFFTYDSYGNIIQTYNTGDMSIYGDEQTEITEYAYRITNNDYLAGYPKHKEILDDTGSTVNEAWYYYDNNYDWDSPTLTKGHATKIETWNSIGANTEVVMTYDDYGNVINTYDALWNETNGDQGNHVSTIYDSVYNQYPVSITNALNQTQTYTYDFAGRVLTETDINNQTTMYEYDVFGRIVKVIGQKDSSEYPTTTYEYSINTNPPHRTVIKNRINHGEPETLDTYTYIDGLGRTCQTKAPAPQNTKQIVSDIKTYNSRGLVEKTYMPYIVDLSEGYTAPDYSKPRTTISVYDSLNRPTKITNADGTTVIKEYGKGGDAWNETVINENGIPKEYIKDAYGRIKEVHEHNGGDAGEEYITKYEYDILGNLTRIENDKGHTTTIEYDSLGRKTEMNDPSMGIWQYEYDTNGNLVKQIDNKNQTISMTYDRLNRITAKTYPDTTGITYTYDSGVNAIGRLSSVTDLSCSTEFEYDELGRNITKTRAINGITG